MEKLLSSLKQIPEYCVLLDAIRNGENAAVTGIGQINRSHFIAGIQTECSRPIVIICQDDMAAKRLQEELKAFLGDTFPVLPNRELTLYDTAVVSRAWEQKRLRQLYDLSNGHNPVQILTWEALCQRLLGENNALTATRPTRLVAVRG